MKEKLIFFADPYSSYSSSSSSISSSFSSDHNPEDSSKFLKPPISKFNPTKHIVLDLDETLIHRSLKPIKKFDFKIQIYSKNRNVLFFVAKRPYLDRFLRDLVSKNFEISIFTASQQITAEPIIDFLISQAFPDLKTRPVFTRFYIDSVVWLSENFYVKDLGSIGMPLDQTIIVDNLDQVLKSNPTNAIHIQSWYGDNPEDDLLLGCLELVDLFYFSDSVSSWRNQYFKLTK